MFADVGVVTNITLLSASIPQHIFITQRVGVYLFPHH